MCTQRKRTSKVYRSNINWVRKTLFVSKSK